MKKLHRENIFTRIASELRVARFVWMTNVRAAMESRIAFGIQVVGMMVNDAAFLIIWIMFFSAVGSANGWGVWQAIGLLGFCTLGFSLAFGFAAGSTELSHYVDDGSMDSFLLSPRNVYWRVLTSKFDLTAFGDALFGAILLVIFILNAHVSLMGILMIIGVLPAVSCIYWGVSMSCATIAFFMPDAENTIMGLYKTFMTPSMYPVGLFPGPVKFVFTFIIPSAVVGGIPVEMVMAQSGKMFALIWVLGVFWIVLSAVLFTFSLRHYESGNAIGLRSAN